MFSFNAVRELVNKLIIHSIIVNEVSSIARSSAVMFSCRLAVPNVTVTNAQTGTIAAGASTGVIILIVIVAAVLCIAAVVFGRYRKKRAFNRSRQLSVNVGRDIVVANPSLETRDHIKEIDALTFVPPYTQSTLPPPYSQIQGFPQAYPLYTFPNVVQPMPNISQTSTIPTTATTTRPHSEYENMACSTANEIPPTTSTEEMYDLVNQPRVSSTDLTYEVISNVRERVL